MKRGRLTAAIAAAIAIPALGLGVGLGVADSNASGAPGASAAGLPERTVVLGCDGRAAVRPRTLTLACADGNDYLTGLSWASWGPVLASASGVQKVNDCVPDCADGHFHGYQVLAVLWRGAAVRGHPGEQRYTTVTLLYPGARPRIYNGHRWVEGPQTPTMTLWSPPN